MKTLSAHLNDSIIAQLRKNIEDWIRSLDDQKVVSHTTTELKNKTGLLLDEVTQGKTVRLVKHGRIVAEIKRPS